MNIINKEDKFILEIDFEELTIIEESLLRNCSYWNHSYFTMGIPFEKITDQRTLISNKMHTQVFKYME